MVFFGSSEFSVYVLDELKLHNIVPELIITTPDKPKGRKLILTPNVVKVWAQINNIPVLDPASLRNNFDLSYNLKSNNYNLFLVASYGKIIPKDIFEIPPRKTLNIHPSLLPKYRGASPIQAQILNDEKKVGVSIMQIEETMDTGPVVVQKRIHPIPNPSPKGKGEEKGGINSSYPLPFGEGAGGGVLGRKELEKHLAIEGARLFAHVLPEWLQGAIDPIMQNEDEATYCQKITKEDGLIDLNGDPRTNLLKIKAFEEWPTAYFFLDTPKRSEGDTGRKRVIITDATIEDVKLKILRVIPEGKKEMLYEDFLRGLKNSK